MQLIFPTMLVQSISVGYTGKSPDVLACVEKIVGTGIIDANTGAEHKRIEHVASERMPFTLAVVLQAQLNARRNVDDQRFGQISKPKIIV